jgi:hypothetical protein
MPETKTRVKYIVDGIDFATTLLTSAADIDTATWEVQPLTLRDDTVEIVDGDPDEDEIFSHEQDAPVWYDVSGTGTTASGSFIKVTLAQLTNLLGGTTTGQKFFRSASKLLIEKSIRFRFKNGGYCILPLARGYVNVSLNPSRDGRTKFPFVFKSLAPEGWNCDFILDLDE